MTMSCLAALRFDNAWFDSWWYWFVCWWTQSSF